MNSGHVHTHILKRTSQRWFDFFREVGPQHILLLQMTANLGDCNLVVVLTMGHVDQASLG